MFVTVQGPVDIEWWCSCRTTILVCSTCRTCSSRWLRLQVQTLLWPAFSPHLSPNEHVWNELQRHVRSHGNQAQNAIQLNCWGVEGLCLQITYKIKNQSLHSSNERSHSLLTDFWDLTYYLTVIFFSPKKANSHCWDILLRFFFCLAYLMEELLQ